MMYRDGTVEHQILCAWQRLAGELPPGSWLEVDSEGERFRVELHFRSPSLLEGGGANGTPVWFFEHDFKPPYDLDQGERNQALLGLMEVVGRISQQPPTVAV